MLLTAESISKKIHKKDKSNRAIFGDGAAATLVCGSENENVPGSLQNFVFGTDGSGYDTIIIKHGGTRFLIPKLYQKIIPICLVISETMVVFI